MSSGIMRLKGKLFPDFGDLLIIERVKDDRNDSDERHHCGNGQVELAEALHNTGRLSREMMRSGNKCR
jgi:hypothetical protein